MYYGTIGKNIFKFVSEQLGTVEMDQLHLEQLLLLFRPVLKHLHS